ncbi:unnamed protein product [Penicillium nalgiovense]|nr:unnamed protein product [Penicillium nalgiovense]
MAYTLFLAPSLRTMQHVLGGRSQTKIASQQQGAEIQEHSIIEGEIYCGEWPNSARSRIRPRWRPTSVLHRVFRPRPTAFALLWSLEPLASRHIHPPWKCNVYRGWVRNAFTVSTNCLVHPSAAFFEASADCDELECDVAWLVTALQRVLSDLVVKPI